MRELIDIFGRTIVEVEPDTWETGGLRLFVEGRTDDQILAIFNALAPSEPAATDT
jgi:hypothetical protein